MKKFTIVALVLVICLGALGVGYAAWKDEVNISGTVQTGSVDLNVTAYSGTDVYKILGTDDLVRYHWRSSRPTAPPDSELVAYAIAEMAGDDQVKITFDNLFPDVEGGFVADWLMQYAGTIPAKLMVDTDIAGIPDDWVTVKAYPVDESGFEGSEVTLEGLQLHTGNRVAVHVIVVVPQIPESMDVSGTITMTIGAIQWNEYCTFTPIAQPGDGTYLADTTLIDISGLTFGQMYSSIGDGTLSVSFADDVGKFGPVPNGWATWGSPPNTESANPDVLVTADETQTLTLSAPCDIFGFELEPNVMAPYEYSVTFHLYSGATLVDTITLVVDGSAGARLFAAQVGGSTGCSFDRIDIVGEPSLGFAIAQVRYRLA